MCKSNKWTWFWSHIIYDPTSYNFASFFPFTLSFFPSLFTCSFSCSFLSLFSFFASRSSTGPSKSNSLRSCHDKENTEDPKISPYSWSSRNGRVKQLVACCTNYYLRYFNFFLVWMYLIPAYCAWSQGPLKLQLQLSVFCVWYLVRVLTVLLLRGTFNPSLDGHEFSSLCTSNAAIDSLMKKGILIFKEKCPKHQRTSRLQACTHIDN